MLFFSTTIRVRGKKMRTPAELEDLYKEYTENLVNWAHDGIISVDLNLLNELNLLEDSGIDNSSDDLTQYFHVIESMEKVTLFNEQFSIWIVPKNEVEVPMTYVFVASNAGDLSRLELVFTTSGVYNTPKFVLKVLQRFLVDMLETQATLTEIERDQSSP